MFVPFFAAMAAPCWLQAQAAALQAELQAQAATTSRLQAEQRVARIALLETLCTANAKAIAKPKARPIGMPLHGQPKARPIGPLRLHCQQPRVMPKAMPKGKGKGKGKHPHGKGGDGTTVPGGDDGWHGKGGCDGGWAWQGW